MKRTTNHYAWRCEHPRCNLETPGDPATIELRCPRCHNWMRLILYRPEQWADARFEVPPVATGKWTHLDWLRWAGCFEVIHKAKT